MIITAEFKGENGSCGYKSGGTYSLRIKHTKGNNITIQRRDGSGLCEYQSMIAFMNNWTRITTGHV